jgi:hypothetical protein
LNVLVERNVAMHGQHAPPERPDFGAHVGQAAIVDIGQDDIGAVPR